MIYQWKDGARLSGDAQAVGNELERIRVRHNGRLEPDWVVHEAKAESNPMHGLFEWNDSVAAQNYRVDQARGVIRSIDVIVEELEQPKPVRAFVSVIRDRDRSYTSISHAMSDAEMRRQLLVEAWASLGAWRKRYAELEELADIFASIDKAQAA